MIALSQIMRATRESSNQSVLPRTICLVVELCTLREALVEASYINCVLHQLQPVCNDLRSIQNFLWQWYIVLNLIYISDAPSKKSSYPINPNCSGSCCFVDCGGFTFNDLKGG